MSFKISDILTFTALSVGILNQTYKTEPSKGQILRPQGKVF